jgi:uncharacterized SAM-binding protein YcdF (DUF218 family)
VLFAALIGVGVALRGMAAYLIVDERLPTRADAIVVLGGGGRQGTRELQAARLFQRGLAPLVITTGGPIAGEESRATYAEWSVLRLVRRGVPAGAAFATNEGDSTLTDALGVRRLAAERGWRDLLLVTDNWHTRRTELLFGRVFAGTVVRLYISPAPSDRFDPAAWWLDEEAALLVLAEYVKLGSIQLLGGS